MDKRRFPWLNERLNKILTYSGFTGTFRSFFPILITAISLDLSTKIKFNSNTFKTDSNTIIFAKIIFKMKHLLSNLRIEVKPDLFVKDPESSALGKKIIEQSILMIDQVGFENFNFKKLGNEIGSNESSVYRYFENKHKLLLYLSSWYWGWKEYQLVFSTTNITDPQLKLKTAIEILTRSVEKDSMTSHIDEVLLNKVVVNEFSKSYLTKEVDTENKEGYFSVYNRLVLRLRDMILAVKHDFPYPASLSSTVIEGALHQHFLKEHFFSLTDCKGNVSPAEYFDYLVFSSLNIPNNG